MYCEFLGLRCLPFEDVPDPRFFFPSTDHEEALALLRFAASSRKGPLLLTGGLGTGKTLLCRTLLACPNHESIPVLGTCTAGDRSGLVRRVCRALDVQVRHSAAPVDDAERLRKLVLAGRSPGHQVILLVLDQVENLTVEQLDELHILCNLEDHERRLVQIILVGKPRVIETLEDPRFEQLRQQIFAFHRLRPFNADEVAGYIRHRLQVAGNADADLFSTDALPLIHQRSGGVPRLVNQICDAALLAAYGAGCKTVDKDLIAETDIPSLTRPTEFGATDGPAATTPDSPEPPAAAETSARIERMLTEGEALARRLELALERAEPLTAGPAQQDPAAEANRSIPTLADRLAELLAQTPKTLEAAERSLQTIERRIQTASSRAEEIAGRLESTIAHSEQLWDEKTEKLRFIDEACDRAVAARQQLSDCADRVAQSFEETQVSQSIERALERLEERSRQIVAEHVGKIEGLTGDCTSVGETLRTQAALAKEKSGQLASVTHAANAASRQATSAIADAHAAADQLAEKIEGQRSATEATTTRLQQAMADCEASADAARQTLARAETATQGLAVENGAAHEKAARLASLIQATSEAGRQASSATEEAQTTTEHLLEKVVEAGSTVEVLERRVQAGTAQTQGRLTAMRDALGSLEESVARSQAATEGLQGRIGAAEQESDRLGSMIPAATDTGQRIAAAVEDARGLTDQIVAKIADGRTAADAIEHRIRNGVADGQSSIELLEHHLHQSVSDGQSSAKMTEQRIRTSVADAEEAIQTIQQRIHACLADAEAGNQTLEQHTAAAVADAEKTTEAIQQRMHACLANAETGSQTLEQRTAAAVADAERTTEAIQQRMHACLANAETGSQTLEQHTATALADAEKAIEAVQQRIHACLTDAEAGGQRFEQRIGAGVARAEESTEVIQQQIQDGIAEAEAGFQALEQRIRTGTAEAETTVGAVEHRIQASLAGGRGEAEALEHRIQAGIADGRARAEDIEDALRRTIADGHATTDGLDRIATRAEATIETLGAATGSADEKSSHLTSVVDAADQAASHLADHLGATENTCQEMGRLIDQATSAARSAEERTEQLANQTNRSTGVLHGLHESVTQAKTLIEHLGTEAPRIREAQAGVDQRIREAGAIESQLLEGSKSAEGACREMGRLINELSSAAGPAEEQANRLAAETGRSADVIHDLQESAAQARTLIERLAADVPRAAEVQAGVDQRIREAGAIESQLLEGSKSAEGACREMGRLINELSSAAGPAEEQANRLAAETDRSANVIDGLQQSADQAKTLIERLTADTPRIEGLQGQVERRIRQAAAVDQQLLEHSKAARQTIEETTRKSDQVRETATALARQAGEATQMLPRLIKVVRIAAVTVKRLTGQREAALATLERQQTLHDQDRVLIEQLQERTTQMEQLVRCLSDLNAEGARIGDRLTADCQRASEVIEGVGRQVEAIDRRKEVIDASDGTLSEFVQHAESISRQVARLQGQADAFEQRIGQLLDQPQRVVAEAKDQSTRLQNVCQAVRKIFAGLSQATLQANQRVEQFSRMSRTSESRAQRLSAETARTAETLKAWVTEAVRVQSRLAESLERCPTVAQTHPVESLHRLATLADRLDTLDADSTRTGQAPVVDSPAVDSPRRARVPTTTANPPAVENPLLGGGPGRARTRAEEVARLIADADKSVEAVR